MELKLKTLLSQVFGVILLVSVTLFVLAFPFTIPGKLAISLILGALSYAVFEYSFLPKTRLVIKTRVHFRDRNYFWYIFTSMYLGSLVLAIMPASLPRSPFYLPWMLSNAFSVAKLLGSVLLTSFFPGYALLSVIVGTQEKRSFSRVGIGVLSVLLSFAISSITTYSHWIAKQGFSSLNHTLFLSYAFFLVLFVVSSHSRRKKIEERERLNFAISSTSFYRNLVLSLVGAYLLWVFFSTHSQPQTMHILHDEFNHVGLTVQLLKGWQSWISVQGAWRIYPYFFHLILLAATSISSVPIINVYLCFFFVLLLPAFAFYFMAQMIFKNERDIPLLATVIFTVFSGFGWIYASLLQKSAINASEVQTIIQAAKGTYDITYSTWLPIYIAPYTVDLAIFIVLIGLINHKHGSAKTLSILTVVLVTLGVFVHFEKMTIFAFLLFILFLLRIFNVAGFMNYPKTMLSSYLVSLLIFFALDFLAPYKVELSYSSFLWRCFLISTIGLTLAIVAKKFRSKIPRLRLRIRRRHLKYALAYSAISLYIVLSVMFFYSVSSYSFNTKSVPLWFLPLKLGVAGLILLFGLFYSVRRNGGVDFFVTLCVGTFLMELILYHLPFSLFPVSFPEYRVVRDVLWTFTSIVAAYGMKGLIEKLGVGLSIDRPLLKYFGAFLLFFLLFAGSLPSHLLKVQYFASAQQFISSEEMEALNCLSTLEIPSGSFILTGFSKDQVYAVTGATTMSLYDDVFASLIFNSKSVGANLWTLHYLNISHVYLNKRDLQFLERGYEDSFFMWLLPKLPLLFSNDAAVICTVPCFSPPLDESNITVVSDDLLSFGAASSKSCELADYYSATLLVALMQISYTTTSELDPSLFNYETIFTPDLNPVETKTSQYINWAKNGGTLLVIDSKEQGAFSNFLGINETGKYVSADLLVDSKGSSARIPSMIVPEFQLEETSTTIIANYTLEENTAAPFAFLRELEKGKIIYLVMTPLLRNLAGSRDIIETMGWVGNLLRDYVRLSPFCSSSYRRTFYVKNIGEISSQGETSIQTSGITFGFETPHEVALSFSNSTSVENIESFSQNITVSDVGFKGAIPAVITVDGNVTLSPLDSNNYVKLKLCGEVSFKFDISPTSKVNLGIDESNYTNMLFHGGVLLLGISHTEGIELVARNPAIATNGTTTFDSLFASYPYRFHSSGNRGTSIGYVEFKVRLSEEEVLLLDEVQLNGDLHLDATTSSAFGDDLTFFVNFPKESAFLAFVIVLFVIPYAYLKTRRAYEKREKGINE